MAFVISAPTDERLNPWKIVHPDQVDLADHHVVPVAAEILVDRVVHLDLVAARLVAASLPATASPGVQVVRRVVVALEAVSQPHRGVDPRLAAQEAIAGEAPQQIESRMIARAVTAPAGIVRRGIAPAVIVQVLIGRVMIVMARIVPVLIVVPRVIAPVGIVPAGIAPVGIAPAEIAPVAAVVVRILIGRVMIVMARIVPVLTVVPRVIGPVGIVRAGIASRGIVRVVIVQVAEVARVHLVARCLAVGAEMIGRVVIARRVLGQVRIILGEAGRIPIVTPRIACERSGQVHHGFLMTLQQRISILAY